MFRHVPGNHISTNLAVQEASDFNRLRDDIPAKSATSMNFGHGSVWNFVGCSAVRRMRTATLKASNEFTSGVQG